MKRKIWYKPALRTEGEHGIHRKVTWLELFYDLFFVVTISQLAHTLTGNLSMEKILAYAFMFLPVWWLWIGTTYYNERFETDGLENRIYHFLLMIPVTGMAVSIHNGLGSGSLGLGLSYLVGRLIINFLWFRAAIHVREFRPTGRTFAFGFTLSVVLMAVSLFVDPPLRFWLWAAAFATDLVTPWLTLKEQAKLPRFSASKLPERFGLLMLIVLGESIVGVVNGLASSHESNTQALISAFLAIAVGFGFWWTYFDYIGRRVPKHNIYANITWSYSHLPLAMGIASFGASLTNIFTSIGHITYLHTMHAYISVAVVYFMLGVLELTLKAEKDEPTHPVLSPALKFISAAFFVLLALIGFGDNSIIILTTIFAISLVHAFYGAYVWFNTEIETDFTIHQ